MTDMRILRSLLVAVVAVVALSGFVDRSSRDYAEAAFTRALVTFAAARTLNGAISVAQGTELALEPGGVGVVLTIGEVLDPINDLVERFSSVMLVAASSLGLQNILLTMTSWWGVTALLVVAGVAAVATLWWRQPADGKLAAAISRIFLVVLFVRFAVPVLILGTNLVSEMFLASEQEAATAAIVATRTEIEELSDDEEPPPDPDEPLLDRLGAMIDDSLQSINATEKLERLKESASEAAEHIINLIVIFVLQTIILPLAFFWLLLEVLKGFVARFTQV